MKFSVKDIDALLPQTQCQQCEYAGCLPYAKAIAEQGEKINKCIPGGVKTLKALGQLTGQATTPFEAELKQKEKPKVIAKIDEDQCIGCTKCIKACPVDAIVGSGKQMHTVITDECTGCELCVEPCPVDCIDLLPSSNEARQQEKASIARQRHLNRQQRLELQQDEKQKKLQSARLASQQAADDVVAARKAYIADAVARVKAKHKRK